VEPTVPFPLLDRRQRGDAFLRRHWKLAAPLLILFMLALFVLPWVWFSFVEALCLQVGGAGLLYILGRLFTTAFNPAYHQAPAEPGDPSSSDPPPRD